MSATNTPNFSSHQFAVQTSPELKNIVESLLAMMFPAHEIYQTDVDELSAFLTAPALSDDERAELAKYLSELSKRPEWSERGTLLREITDSTGTRLDVRVPIPPHTDPGVGLYGPFATAEHAQEWIREHAPYQLESDVFSTPAGSVVELFRLV